MSKSTTLSLKSGIYLVIRVESQQCLKIEWLSGSVWAIWAEQLHGAWDFSEEKRNLIRFYISDCTIENIHIWWCYKHQIEPKNGLQFTCKFSLTYSPTHSRLLKTPKKKNKWLQEINGAGFHYCKFKAHESKSKLVFLNKNLKCLKMKREYLSP